ncbi:MAG TPA: hypothetical protein VLS90_09710 [Thermodesulfobacteriota bacterium]|nr:hypothetical protein [Thermodesulfobacteriota bacterium]
MEFTLSRNPLHPNTSCAHCGRVFQEKGVSLQIREDRKVVDFPICQPCFEAVARFEAVLNMEEGYARVRR